MYRLPAVSDIGYLLEAAMTIDDAVGACLQVVEEEGRAIRVVLERGLKPEYFEKYRVVRSGFQTSCAQSFTERRRVVIRDVETDPAYEALRDVALDAGYRSVQTTPLIDEDRNFHGLFSTYFDRAHHPEPDSLREIDRHAHVAMLILQAHALQLALKAADGRLGIRGRAMPAGGAQAAEAACRALPGVARGDDSALVAATTNMEAVVKALRGLLRAHRRADSSTATAASATA